MNTVLRGENSRENFLQRNSIVRKMKRKLRELQIILFRENNNNNNNNNKIRNEEKKFIPGCIRAETVRNSFCHDYS